MWRRRREDLKEQREWILRSRKKRENLNVDL